MANSEPIKEYVAALEAKRSGRKQEAAAALAKAMGAAEPTQTIKTAVNKLLTPGTPANDVALGLVASECARRK